MEVMDIVLGMWRSEGKFRYRGKFFKVEGPDPRPDLGIGLHMKPYQTPHPPIAVAAGSPFSATAKYAGSQGWILMSSGITHPSLLWTIWDAYQRGSPDADKSSDRKIWRVSRNIHVAETMEKAQKEADEHGMRRCIEGYAMPQFKALMGSLSMFKSSEEMTDEEITFDWLINETFIVGDPAFVIRRIKELYSRVGGFGTLLLQLNDWDPPEIGLNSLKLFMSEVAPSIRGLGEGSVDYPKMKS
jgi:alkanesulfonate monooxygenase SsuD/methylene tetrahydromethanopterin reductase-like flavin-dependent oxidoreductase (luciferase family)